jgi:hypothetical protein
MATSGKLVSLKTIVERVYMDFGFNYSLSFTEAAEWAGSLLALLKAPLILKHHVEEIVIDEGRGKLPCDLESIIQTARKVQGVGDGCATGVIATLDRGTQYVEISAIDIVNRRMRLCGCNAFTTCDECTTIEGPNIENNIPCEPRTPIIRRYGGGTEKPNFRLEPMRWATDSFNNNMHCTDNDFGCKSANTYTVNGNYIFTSFDHGSVMMAFLAIPTDEEGYPLIPADEWWRQAVQYEIAYKIAMKLFIQGNIADKVYQHIERERDWKVAQAVNKSKMPSIDEMESFKNQWLRLIPNYNNHNTFFKNMQVPERMFNHPYRYF